jgi:hypothetical protein
VKKDNKDTIGFILVINNIVKTKKQKIIHHDKLEDEFRSDKII